MSFPVTSTSPSWTSLGCTNLISSIMSRCFNSTAHTKPSKSLRVTSRYFTGPPRCRLIHPSLPLLWLRLWSHRGMDLNHPATALRKVSSDGHNGRRIADDGQRPTAHPGAQRPTSHTGDLRSLG